MALFLELLDHGSRPVSRGLAGMTNQDTAAFAGVTNPPTQKVALILLLGEREKVEAMDHRR